MDTLQKHWAAGEPGLEGHTPATIAQIMPQNCFISMPRIAAASKHQC